MTEPATPAGVPGQAADSSGQTGWGPGRGQATTTLLLRHGQTAMSAERKFAGRGDIPLTKDGMREAQLAARRLARMGGVDAIVTSPLQRARRTAEAVAEATTAPIQVDDDLVEADFGEWEGLTFSEIHQRWPAELAAWTSSPDVAPPGGESFAAVALRVLTALNRMLTQRPHQTIVVVSHVTPIKTLLCRALLAPPDAMFRINLDVASLSRVDCFDNGSALVRSVNDTAHLQAQKRSRWRR